MRTVEEIRAEISLLEEEEAEAIADCAGAEYINGIHYYNRAKIKRLNNEMAGIITNGISLDRLTEICTAEREGRCVVLPCKVGDTVYKTKAIFTDYKEPKEEMVIGFAYPWHDPSGDSLLICCKNGIKIDERQIGKTVFLTRSEAEAALREGEN